MSVDLMGAVWKRAPYEGGALLVLLAMADWADDDGEGIFPTIKKLAAKSRLKPRAVQLNLRKLEEDGIIIQVNKAPGKRGQSNEWVIDVARLQNMRPIGDATATDTKTRHNIRRDAAENTEAAQDVVERHIENDDSEGRNIYTPSEAAATAAENAPAQIVHPAENARVQSSAGDGCTPLRGTGAIDDISPTPPHIDIHQVIHQATHQGAGAREAEPVVETNKPIAPEPEPPAFLRRYSEDFNRFVAAWPRGGEGPEEIHTAWRAVTHRPPIEDMLRAVGLYVADVTAENAKRPADNQKPWCNAVTWLKNRRWEGYLAKEARAAEVARSQPLQAKPWGAHPAATKLLDEFGAERFNHWFRPCTLAVVDGIPVLSAPNTLIRDTIAAQYIDSVERAFGKTVVVQ